MEGLFSGLQDGFSADSLPAQHFCSTAREAEVFDSDGRAVGTDEPVPAQGRSRLDADPGRYFARKDELAVVLAFLIEPFHAGHRDYARRGALGLELGGAFNGEVHL